MPQVGISAQSRVQFGKGAARKLRASGQVPAIIYGPDTDPVAVSLPAHDLMLALKVPEVILELQVDGKSFSVAPRQVQRHPVRLRLDHLDLLVLSPKEVRERLVVGRALIQAEQLAVAAELEPATVISVLRELLDEGQDPDQAIPAAIEQVKEQLAAAEAKSAEADQREDANEAAAAAGEGAAAG